MILTNIFQSTLPARGATAPSPDPNNYKQFQSTLPARGATEQPQGDDRDERQFQSTLPARGATVLSGHVAPLDLISIHAPRTGSDRTRRANITTFSDFNPRSPHGERPSGSSSPMPNSLFQSTLPARGATIIGTINCKKSIYFNPRSPHGERRRERQHSRQLLQFQPTLPARGATKLNIIQ